MRANPSASVYYLHNCRGRVERYVYDRFAEQDARKKPLINNANLFENPKIIQLAASTKDELFSCVISDLDKLSC